MGCVARSALVLDPVADQVSEIPPQTWRIVLSIIFLLAAGLLSLLSWVGTCALGHPWRIDAGLNPDHETVTSGVYRVVRHPIYTSMLCGGRFGTTRIDHRGPRMVRGPWRVDLQPVAVRKHGALRRAPVGNGLPINKPPISQCFSRSKCRATIYVGSSELRRTNLTTQDYAALTELRHQIRRFVRFSEEISRNTGLKPQQHQ
jgi:hypothetical protein